MHNALVFDLGGFLSTKFCQMTIKFFSFKLAQKKKKKKKKIFVLFLNLYDLVLVFFFFFFFFFLGNGPFSWLIFKTL